jgi:ADP-heptose:LPS heptosyltransferase
VQADPIKTQAWQARWQAHDRWHVGLTFSGSSTHLHDHYRSIALNTLVAQLPTHYQGRAIQYVSLQKEYRPHDLAALSSAGVIDVSASLDDFSDTAALCASMDHIISVDTSVAHLAGALGQPLSLLLPLVPDWRWGTTADDGAWYPSARLYRQSIKNDWSHPLAVLQDHWRTSSNVMKLKA